jgi:hypothetical protein
MCAMQFSASFLMVAATIVAAAAAVVLFALRGRKSGIDDLGVISSQWIAQHKASTHDSRN